MAPGLLFVPNLDQNALRSATSGLSVKRPMADKVSYKVLLKWIPDLTRYRFNIARHHILLHGRGVAITPSKNTRMYVSEEKIEHFLTFITSTHIVQDLPFGEKILKLSSGDQLRIPNVVRTLIPEHIILQYQGYCRDTGFGPASRNTLAKILKVCSASTRKSLHGLDYFSATGAKAFDELELIVEKIGDEYGKGLTWARETTEKLKQAKRYLKGDYKVHVSNNSMVADHCRMYALSYSNDPDYKETCSHEHNMHCDRCDLLHVVLDEIISTIDSVQCSNEEKEDMEYVISHSVKDIEAWKAHLLRSINQDVAQNEVLNNLDNVSVVLVSDWAMKFLPQKFRESQRDWFGKRGLSWHLTVALRKNAEQELQTLTFVHIFENCNQDSPTVLAIFDDVLHQLKDTFPDVKSIYMKQDNAGCYHSASTMLAINQIATKNGINLSRIDFSDPQGGKAACDRKAATIKNHMKRYLHSGLDIDTAEQMKTAIESTGGIAGVRVTLSGPQSTSGFKSVKWDGVSYINNIQYSETGGKIWRAYDVGPGKSFLWSDISLPDNIPKLQIKASPQNHDISFVSVKARKLSKGKSRQYDSDYDEEEEEEAEEEEEDAHEGEDVEKDDNESAGGNAEKLFFCPEEGCIKSFKRYSSFEKHLDCGNHKYSLENQTLYDKAMTLYATKLEHGMSELHEIPEVLFQFGENSKDPLPMGWALKSSGKRVRFNETQKAYLSQVFKAGEETGQKADPVTVSKAMRKAKDLDGSRIFKKDEFLSPQQISGFFSRLARGKTLSSHDDNGEKETNYEDQLDIDDQFIQELTEEVMNTVALQHPITYEMYNICEISQKSKLSQFSIQMLKDICSSLELDTSNVKVKRKLPYIELLTQLVNKCSCCTSSS